MVVLAPGQQRGVQLQPELLAGLHQRQAAAQAGRLRVHWVQADGEFRILILIFNKIKCIL